MTQEPFNNNRYQGREVEKERREKIEGVRRALHHPTGKTRKLLDTPTTSSMKRTMGMSMMANLEHRLPQSEERDISIKIYFHLKKFLPE